MAKIRSSVALVLMLVDLIGTITLFSLIISCISDIDHNNGFNSNTSYLRKLSQKDNPHINLRGTKLKLIEYKKFIEKVKSKKVKIYNPSDYNEDEFILQQNREMKSSKNLRKLDSYYDVHEDTYLIIVSFVSIFFTLVLMISFCLDKNECCTSDTREELGLGCCIYCICCDDCERRNRNRNCNGDCNCNCGGGDERGLLIIFFIVIIFVLIFFAIKACGKHVSRYISISAIFLCNVAIFVLTLMYAEKENSDYFPIILTISGVLAFANFLGVLLPNLSCCLSLTYGYRPENAEPILNKTTANEPILKPAVLGENLATPVIQPETSYYSPQVPSSAYPKNPAPYQPQPIPASIYVQPPSNQNTYYNSEQGNIYDAPPVNYQANPQPQSIYDVQLPTQQEVYSKPQ